MSLRDRVTTGVTWSAVERLGQVGCAFVVQVVLARLLLPEQFGLIAMVAVFVAISNAVVDSGFANALIQKKVLNDADISTAWLFNLGMGLFSAGLLWLAAPVIAGFYAQAELIAIVRWLSLSLVLGAIGGVQNALLTRKMAFRSIALSSMPSTLISGILGIVMANAGCGVWALVGQLLSQQALRSLFLWLASDWRPRLHFSATSFTEMFHYGSRLAISGVLDQGFRNLYVLVIGKFFLPVDVGYFQRAQSLQQLPATNVQAIMGRVLFPLFSGMQDDPVRLRRAMRLSLQGTSFLIFPSMALLAALATPLVTVLLGEKWLPVVPLLQPLCLVGALYPWHAANLNLLKALGRSDAFLRLEVIKKVLIVVNIAITFRFGVLTMIYGMMISSVIGLAINVWYSKRLLNYGLGLQCRDVFRTILLGGGVGVVAAGVISAVDLHPLWLLLLGGSIGLLVWLAGVRLLDSALRTQIIEQLTRILPGSTHWVRHCL